jgi:chemotaxis protein CheD
MTLTLPHKQGLLTPTQPASEERTDAISSNSRFLHAGQVHVSTDRESIVFILGSCVAVSVWDPISGIGGAAHYLLPIWDGRGSSSPRYGNVAISVLLQKLVDAGADRLQLRAKVFGGGCLLGMRENAVGKEHLGGRNVEIAKEILTKEHILIVSSDVGGERGKRVLFHTDTGEAVVKEL